MAKTKKVDEKVEEVQEVEETEIKVGPSALELRRQALLSLRGSMVAEGVDSIGKLDVLLSQVNEQLR